MMPQLESQVVQVVGAQLVWKVEQDPSTRSWIGQCDAIRQTALGDSFNDLVHNSIRNLMQELFNDLLSEGELEDFLRQQGWRLIGESKPVPQQRYEFDVPFQLERAGGWGAGVEAC